MSFVLKTGSRNINKPVPGFSLSLSILYKTGDPVNSFIRLFRSKIKSIMNILIYRFNDELL